MLDLTKIQGLMSQPVLGMVLFMYVYPVLASSHNLKNWFWPFTNGSPKPASTLNCCSQNWVKEPTLNRQFFCWFFEKRRTGGSLWFWKHVQNLRTGGSLWFWKCSKAQNQRFFDSEYFQKPVTRGFSYIENWNQRLFFKIGELHNTGLNP